jgi:concanavalin A-like lectin/glucanase superfamily protein
MRNRRLWIVSVAAATVLGSGGAAHATADHTIALWNMNEPSGARTMYDSSDHDQHGTIGREIEAGARFDGARGYHFSRLEPDTPPAHPRHLVTVPDDGDLDPGTRDYAVTLRLRTRDQFGNVIQKGQATVSGGSFKVQMPSGHVQCWFRGSAGSLLVTAPRPINDGRWHTIRCDRDRDGVWLSIDGEEVAGRDGWTGSIANAWPVSIGGKTDCDQVDVGCDYFSGDIDYVRLEADGHDW